MRLPKEYRFETAEVRIRPCGDALVPEPMSMAWGWLGALAAAGLDADFVEAAVERSEGLE